MIPSRQTVGRALETALKGSLIPALLVASGCGTTAPSFDHAALRSGSEKLTRPLPGDPAALYRLRVPSSGGLRMALLTRGREGRLTVSEPFGSAVSITAWSGLDDPDFFDLRQGCRLEASGLTQALGVGALPLPQAVRLLSGRLPAEEDDVVVAGEDGRILVKGRGWSANVEIMADPWRVVVVEDAESTDPAWRLSLSDHSSSVPGVVRIAKTDGRWAEIELVRLEWNEGGVLPVLPELPRCVEGPKP